MRGTRVIVLGAGIVGSACAQHLAAAGADVLVVERDRPAGATTAHGEGNLLVSDKGPGAELELARLSRKAWPEVLDALGDHAPATEWQPKGGIVVATTEAGAHELTAFARAQREAGVAAEPLELDALVDVEPWLTREVTASFHYPDDAQAQPAAAATAMLSAALRDGATLRTGAPAVEAIITGGRITGVRTAAGETLTGDVVVNATGPWAGEVARCLGAPIQVHPRRGEVLVTTPMPSTVWHKVYDADYVGAVGSGSAELQTSAVVESTRAGTILLGSSRRQVGFDDRLDTGVLAAIAATALRLFPRLAGVPVMRSYGGFRPYVPDHLPVIGSDPRLPGLWHASGHEGAGIGLSVGTARVLRDLMLGREPEIDAEPFRIGRPAVVGEGEPE